MLCDPSGHDLADTFALVAYIPHSLHKFLDDLRRELVPGCVPNAHVTILPPRRLAGTPAEAIESLRTQVPEFSPFEIETGEVEVFPVSDVVYLSIEAGGIRLAEMYRALNAGPLKYQDPFPYHPHITLAQNLSHDRAVELASLAAMRWSEYPYPRLFPVESLSFVQNTTGNLWVDLAHFQMDPAHSIHR